MHVQLGLGDIRTKHHIAIGKGFVTIWVVFKVVDEELLLDLFTFLYDIC